MDEEQLSPVSMSMVDEASATNCPSLFVENTSGNWLHSSSKCFFVSAEHCGP